MLSGGTPAEGRLSDVRQRQVGRGVAGRDCSFNEFGSTCAGTVTARVREVDRSARKRGVEPDDRIPPAEEKPLGSRFAAVRGAFYVSVGSRPPERPPGDDVAAAIQRFEDRLRKARPDVKYIGVEPIPWQSQPSPIAR
jgi:hypothetical protein